MEQALGELLLAIRDHDWHRCSLAAVKMQLLLKPVPIEPDPVMAQEPLNAALEGDEA